MAAYFVVVWVKFLMRMENTSEQSTLMENGRIYGSKPFNKSANKSNSSSNLDRPGPLFALFVGVG